TAGSGRSGHFRKALSLARFAGLENVRQRVEVFVDRTVRPLDPRLDVGRKDFRPSRVPRRQEHVLEAGKFAQPLDTIPKGFVAEAQDVDAAVGTPRLSLAAKA